MLTTEAPDVCELALHGFTTKEAGGLAVKLSTARDADAGVHISSTFEGFGSRFVRSCFSVSITIIWDSGVTTVLDDVASGLVTTVLDELEVFFLFLVFTSDRASCFS